jgi:hypothetical protein
VSESVLPGFEDEAQALEDARRKVRAARRQAAFQPTIEGPNKAGNHVLTRTHAYQDDDGTKHRAVTAILTPLEWAVVTRKVLAEHALSPLDEAS